VAPGASQNILFGVSCATANACIAVGESTVGDVTQEGAATSLWAERWDGSAWTVETPATPPLSSHSSFRGVSCASATDCTAVGYYENTSDHALFAPSPGAERWNGISWTEQPTGDDRIGPMLRSVSCPTTSLCLAGGEGTVQRWRPSSGWTFDSVPVSGV